MPSALPVSKAIALRLVTPVEPDCVSVTSIVIVSVAASIFKALISSAVPLILAVIVKLLSVPLSVRVLNSAKVGEPFAPKTLESETVIVSTSVLSSERLSPCASAAAVS